MIRTRETDLTPPPLEAWSPPFALCPPLQLRARERAEDTRGRIADHLPRGFMGPKHNGKQFLNGEVGTRQAGRERVRGRKRADERAGGGTKTSNMSQHLSPMLGREGGPTGGLQRRLGFTRHPSQSRNTLLVIRDMNTGAILKGRRLTPHDSMEGT